MQGYLIKKKHPTCDNFQALVTQIHKAYENIYNKLEGNLIAYQVIVKRSDIYQL